MFVRGVGEGNSVITLFYSGARSTGRENYSLGNVVLAKK